MYTNNDKDDTLAKRKKAQQDFLELKKMQSGEIEPEAVSAPIKPTTVKGKLSNFWFHYKLHTIFTLFIAIVLVIGITQCSKQEKYDGRVVLYINQGCTDLETDLFKEALLPYFTDINNDGEVKIQIINCAHTTTNGAFDMEYTSALSSKLQSIISSDGDVQLFIVDDKKIAQLDGIIANSGIDSFFVEQSEFSEEFYKKATDIGVKLPKKVYLARRIVGGTMIENVKNIETYTEQAITVMEEFKK